MAKELPNTNAPPDVFQMFNANRTYYFESDISSLPHLPCTLPAPVPPSPPKLHKSFSQPQLHLTSTSSGNPTESIGSSAPLHPAGNLPISRAILGSSSQRYPLFRRMSSDQLNTKASLESHYQTEPSYSSSHILKSFKEFKLFGHNNRSSVTTDNNPQLPKQSLDDLDEPTIRKMQLRRKSEPALRRMSEPAALALVKEETEEMKNEMLPVLPEKRSEEEEVKSQSMLPSVMSSAPADHVDGEALKEKSLPLTKKMMHWFTTPQKQTSVNKTEMNAMGPTSF